MPSSIRLLVAVATVFAIGYNPPAAAQTNYFWNYSSTDPTSASSWSPSGPPTAADTAVFGTFDGTAFNLPSFPADLAVGGVDIFGPRPLVITQFLGNGHTLTVGTGGSMTTAPFTARGSFGATVALNNLTVNIANGTTFPSGIAQTLGAVDFSGFASRFDLTNGSQLRLIDAAGTTNYDLTINGGALLRVNAGTVLTNGIGVNSAGQGSIRFHGGGTLIAQGANNTSSTFDLNRVVAASGHSSVGVFVGTGASATVRLNLGNGTLQSGIDRTSATTAGNFLSLGTGTIEFNFNSVIPGFSGSQAQLTLGLGSSPNFLTVQNGVITEDNGPNSNSPYVIMTGRIPGLNGVTGRFAAYDFTTSEVTAQQGTTRTEANISSVAANENVIYRPTSSSANPTLSASIAPQTIVFEPQASGQSIDLGGNTLTTPGILVERPVLGSADYHFSISNGTIAGPTGTSLRNIFVLGAGNTFFDVGATFAAGGGIVKSGTGTMVLTGSTPQMDIGGVIYINQGAIRARIDGGSANLGVNNVLALRGGVLEVNANGGTSTFSRNLGNGLGQVNWTFGTSTTLGDRGSGGFAVVNGNLDVNIGGAGQTLVWNGTSGGSEYFLRSGQSLRLGSFQQTGVVTLQNNLALDDGSVGLPIESRQIITESLSSAGFSIYAERARITGVVSGSASSGLMKIGPGMLELTGANTYAGGTSVDVGTLLVNNTTGSGTGTGRVVVYGMLMGNGFIAPSSGNGVTVMPNAYLAPYGDQLAGTPGSLTVGSAGVNNPVTLRAASIALFQLNGTTFNPNGGNSSYGRLTVKGTGVVTVNGANLVIGVNNGFTPSGSDVFGILDNQTGGAINGTFAGIANGGIVNAVYPDNSPAGTFHVSYFGDITGGGISITGGNDIVLYNFVPVPEPGSILAVCAAAIGILGLARRVRGRAVVSA